MASQDIIINSLSGGMNDTDPPNNLSDNQCVLAENVEFFNSAVGERRNGCGPLDITSSNLDDEALIVHLSQWLPTNDVLAPEFFAVGATPGTSVTVSVRTAGTWAELTPTDAFTNTSPDIYAVQIQSLNGKLFIAYRSSVDRMHVRDAYTSNLRRAGLTEPAAPTGANTGSGTYATVRYFRVRYLIKNGSVIVAKSEPSISLAFTPSGTGSGAVITKPATISEGETHWLLEASVDDATFYEIATTAVATTTYTDSTVYAAGYADQGSESDSIGSYILLPSARYLAVDGDRLIGAGHFTDASQKSTVWWTPTFSDPGSSNDERLPIVTTGGQAINSSLNLDNYDGGPITGICASDYGTWYAFKWVGIYKMVRTGDVTNAYDVVTLSKRSGAIEGSIIRGIDENGASCIYFLDPLFGPSRVGPAGIQTIRGLQETWSRINLQASAVVARAVFYPYKQQVHWWIAVDGSDRPTLKLVLQVSNIKSIDGGSVQGCWSLATGRIAEAAAAAVFTEIVSIDGVASLSERPFIGLTSPDFIQRCDTEGDDAGTAYTATIRTRPFIVNGLLNRWGAMSASLLAVANENANIKIKFIRDFGAEENVTTTSLAPDGDETLVIKDFDDFAMSGARTIQVEFTDIV